MINKLTKKQEKSLAVYCARGIEKGLNTEQISEKVIVDIMCNVYKNILDKAEVPVKIYASPRAAWQAVVDHTGIEDKQYIHPCMDGHMFSYYFAFYDYMIEVLDVQIDNMKKYNCFKGIQELGNIYPLNDICIVSQKPVKINMKEGKLHCEDGPSIEYADGFCVYSLNGVKVPEWLVTTKWNKIDPYRFANIDNVEVRREFVRKVGIERIVIKCGGIVLDKQGDYELIEIDLRGTTGKYPYLKMKNPSIGVWHMECVPKGTSTVKEALKWRNQSDLEPEVLT